MVLIIYFHTQIGQHHYDLSKITQCGALLKDFQGLIDRQSLDHLVLISV
jgi:hypothetical protein